jgi:predicted kinase
MIVLMAGLPGSGKTTLARELTSRTHGRIVSKDEIRHALFAVDEIEYSSQQDNFCLQIMLETAGYLLRRNRHRIVFLDGRTFSRRYQIDTVLSAAARLDQSWRILECVCSEKVAKKRLQKEAGTHPAGNRDFQLYRDMQFSFESITLPKTIIDTTQPMQSCVERALVALR